MKTITAALALALHLLAAPALPAATDADAQLRHFATCAGRLSAQMEHQWLFDTAAADITQRQRAAVIDLIDAILPHGRGPEVLNWRIDAKIAHAALLTRASFGNDPADAAWAAAMAERLTADCTGFLLG